AGSVLIVPRGATGHVDVTGHVADNAQLSLAPEIVTRRTVVKARRGETVAAIARRHNVSVGEVADWNDIAASAVFKAGQAVVLHLPVRAAAAAATVRAAAPAARAAAPSARTPVRAAAPVRSVTRAPVRKPDIVQKKRR
ncbi:MAG TPA: LysM domain-containing protein, partial [Ramlibacter sp.]